jgi:hypothetical protein
MKHKIFFVSLLVMTVTVCFAQEKNKFRFTSVNQVGTLSGESSTQLQIQTINGISYKTISAGVGVGLDYYYQQTVPVFIDLRKKFFDNSSPIVFVDAGYSIPTKNSLEEFEMDRKGGMYYAVGLGYEFPIDKKVNAVFDVGYSYKRFSKIIDNEPWRSSIHEFATYDYSLNRISVKAGLRF